MKPTLRATVPMPGAEGRIDHPAMDVEAQGLLPSAPGNNTVARSLPGMNEPLRAGYGDAGNVRYRAAHRRTWVSYDEGGISAVDIAIGERIMFANAPDACAFEAIDCVQGRIPAKRPRTTAANRFPICAGRSGCAASRQPGRGSAGVPH